MIKKYINEDNNERRIKVHNKDRIKKIKKEGGMYKLLGGHMLPELDLLLNGLLDIIFLGREEEWPMQGHRGLQGLLCLLQCSFLSSNYHSLAFLSFSIWSMLFPFYLSLFSWLNDWYYLVSCAYHIFPPLRSQITNKHNRTRMNNKQMYEINNE